MTPEPAETGGHDDLIAVLTGDLVRSTKLSPGDIKTSMEALRAVIAAEIAPEQVASPFDVFRGDGWQIALRDPGASLRLAIRMRARLIAEIGSDTHVAIAVGGYDRLDAERSSMSVGDAFTRSGRTLDASVRRASLIFALPERPKRSAASMRPEIEDWIAESFGLADALIGAWTRVQASHVELKIAHPDKIDEELGEMCDPPITKQSFGASLNRANWRAFSSLITTFTDFFR